MKSPFFSVIIPVFNREKRLPKALESLKNQSCQDFETIIIDDCSTDDSYNVALKYPLKNKRLLKNNVNSERCKTRNKGILVSKGLFICFLDSDDYHLSDHLEKLKKFIIENGKKKAFYFTNSLNETEEGVRSKRVNPKILNKNIYTYLLMHTINPQRWSVHNEVMKNCLFDENINICEDLDVSLRIARKKIPFLQLNEETTIYVHASDSFTQSDPRKNEREYECYQKIFERKELKKVLPASSKNRLLSKCHYFFALKADTQRQKRKVLWHAFISFCLYPKSYNGTANKVLFVTFLYNLPLFGHFFKKTIQLLKNVSR